MKSIKLFFFIYALALPIITIAQTVQWAVRPTSALLESYGQLYKIKRNGKTGLIDRDNNTIIPVEYDSITTFRNGYALLLNKKGEKMKIEGVVSDNDYDIQPVSEEIFATNYLWFSEGKMPIQGDGGWGYLGIDGNMIIPCQFQIAYPFSEGFASVKIDDMAYYINRNMDYLPVEGGEWGLVYASTFLGNEAVIYTKNMKGYVINRKGRQVRPYKVNVNSLKTNAIDHSVGNKAQIYNDHVANLPVDNSYVVYEENHLFGYKRNDQVLVPAQFEVAEPVRGDYANVRFNGQNGVIRFVEGNVNVNVLNDTVKVSSGFVESGSLQLSLPKDLEDAIVQLRIKDNSGKEMQVRSNVSQGTNRVFYFRPAEIPDESKAIRCNIDIYIDDIAFSKMSYIANYSVHKPQVEKTEDDDSGIIKPSLSAASFTLSAPKARTVRANPSDVFYITVAVSNSGDERGSANIVLYVDEKKIGESTVSVRGHGIANAVIAVPNVKKERWGKAKALLANNGKSSDIGEIHFLPFW